MHLDRKIQSKNVLTIQKSIHYLVLPLPLNIFIETVFFQPHYNQSERTEKGGVVSMINSPFPLVRVKEEDRTIKVDIEGG